MPPPDRSRSAQIELQCTCGRSFGITHWAIIDAVCSPQRARELAGGTLRRRDCPACHRPVYSSAAIAVLIAVSGAELILDFPGPDGAPVLDRHPDLADEHGDSLILPLPDEAAAVVLGRNLDADVGGPASAVEEVRRQHGPGVAASYDGLLRQIGSRHLAPTMRFLSVLERLVDGDARDFEAVVADDPDLLSDDVLAGFAEMERNTPEASKFLRATANLARAARDDPHAAWAAYHEALADHGDQTNDELEVLQSDLAEVIQSGDLDQVVPEARWAIERAEQLGNPLFAAFAREELAKALLAAPSGDHAYNVEAAIGELEQAVTYAPDDDTRGGWLMQLGLAYGMRIHDDARRNSERSVELLAEAVTVLQNGDPSRLAHAQTSLALGLEQRESGDRMANLRQAEKLCQQALRWRSPQRNAEDWAYTQINLGQITEKLARQGKGRLSQAKTAPQAIIDCAEDVPPLLVGYAHLNIAAVLDAEAELARPRRAAQKRREAAEHAETAASVLEGVDDLGRGRAVGRLADYRAGTDDDSALALAQEASALVRPTLAPGEAQTAATRLGSMLASRGDWDAAAAAYRDALQANNLVYFARAQAGDRAAHVSDSGTLSRWAAYVFARNGSLWEAVQVLEDGRTRELRRRLPVAADELAVLAEESPQLHREYLQAVDDVSRAALVDDQETAAQRHQNVIERIRALDGLQEFATAASKSDITAAVEPGAPLVYIDPAPDGTALLILSRTDESSDPTVEAAFIGASSQRVMLRVMMGVDDPQALKPDKPSLLVAVGGGNADLGEALDGLLPWIGETLMRPLAERLGRLGAEQVTLIVSGPLVVVPLHAASWRADAGETCLADRFVVRYAPSATLHARAGATQVPEPIRLAALGDPRGDLASARAEVESIAQHFGDRSEIAVGDEATADFLLAQVGQVSHLHLACHASGEIFDFRQTGLQLADRDLPLTELAGLGRLNARLAVASACQTAVTDAVNLDEAYSIGAVLLAAGAACSIASLWEVDDYATALLMTRLYEEMFDSNSAPPRALHDAQQWLRTLTSADHDAYLTRHPGLEEELSRQVRAGRPSWLPRRSQRATPEPELPFSHPHYWAGFLAFGA